MQALFSDAAMPAAPMLPGRCFSSAFFCGKSIWTDKFLWIPAYNRSRRWRFVFDIFLNILYVMLRVSGGGSFPQPLDAQRERECLERMWQGDEDARAELIEHNLRLVAHVVKKYCSINTREQEDLLSIGTIGLIKAINTYKSDRGTRLATYTARCIENAILS